VQPDDPDFHVANPATWYTAERQAFFRAMVADPAFPSNNFLADDRRYPVTLIGTNSARAFATNAMAGRQWAEYSSETYKTLPQVKGVRKDLPGIVAGGSALVDAPAGGPGYYRTAVRCWPRASVRPPPAPMPRLRRPPALRPASPAALPAR
jgi:hypothetical protein